MDSLLHLYPKFIKFGFYWILIGWFHRSVQTFQPIVWSVGYFCSYFISITIQVMQLLKYNCRQSGIWRDKNVHCTTPMIINKIIPSLFEEFETLDTASFGQPIKFNKSTQSFRLLNKKTWVPVYFTVQCPLPALYVNKIKICN